MTRNSFPHVFIFLFVWTSTTIAQHLSDSSSTKIHLTEGTNVQWYSLLEYIPQQWQHWWDVSFTKERTDEWLAIGGLTLATYMTDDATYSPAQRFYTSSPEAKRWTDFFAGFGDGRTQFIVAGSFAAYGLAFEDRKALRTGIQVASVVLSSGAVIQVLKHVTGRESPFVRTTSLGVWKILPNQIDYHRKVPYFDAFPSGHICTSIATVIVIAENYPDTKWIRPVGYTLTTLVGLGMLANGIHWVSDYPLGLFIGYYFGMVAAHPEGFEISHNANRTKISLLPNISPEGTGISVVINF